MRHFGPAFWTKWKLDVANIQHSTDRAVLIRIPHLAYKDYVFWFPKAMIKRFANTSERVRIVIPPLFNVTIQKGRQKYVVPAEFAFSCITNPERHQENTIELERAYREYAGF